MTMTETTETTETEETPPVRLDIACGQRKEEGWVGIDIADIEGVDIVHDLTEFPWPIEDNSVDEAKAIHYLEHVRDLIPFMNEVHRILKPGAQLLIVSPYWSSSRHAQDPTHCQPIVEQKFLYFNQEWLTQNGLNHYGVTADFDFTYGYNLNAHWQTRSQEALAFAIAHYHNVVDDLVVTLTKRSA